jgi:multidrug resistance efflux pump
VVLITLLLVVGGALAWLLVITRQEPPRRASTALPPYVESIVVRAEDAVERYTGYGTVEPKRTANLAAEVAATVLDRIGGIRVGAAVTSGQELIRLDQREYALAQTRAEALAAAEDASIAEIDVQITKLRELMQTAENELRVAESEKNRVTDLFERELAAKKEFDFANLAYQQARRVVQGYERELAALAPRRDRLVASRRAFEADAEIARLNIQRCVIKAPFAGRIGSIHVDCGDRVNIGTVVLTIVDASTVEIPIRLPGAVYSRVKTGAPCRVECESASSVSWEGEVARVAPTADEQSRTFAAYVMVDNARQSVPLVPGTFVRAVVEGPVHPHRILLPRGAFRSGRVFVVEGGVARLRTPTIERFMQDRALINGDIHDGDRVILSHLDRLADGLPVRVHAGKPAAATASTRPSEADKVSTP